MSGPVPFHPSDEEVAPAPAGVFHKNGGALRTLPHSIEAEEYVLASCMMDGAGVIPRCIAARIVSDTFYDTKNAIIYECLLSLYARQLPTEITNVAEELKSTGQLDQVGGYSFLTQITHVVPTTAQAAHFITQLCAYATRREIIRAATIAVEDSYSHVGDITDLTGDLRRRLDFAIDGPPGRIAWPDTITAADLCANPPPTPPELIAGVLYLPGSMLMAGPSKAFKTFTALDAAIAIAGGTKWLGHPTTQTPVLYLNLELEPFAMEHRISKICAARGEKWPKDLHLWNLKGYRVSLEQLQLQLPAKLKKTGCKVVSIDPHYKISSVSGMEENSNDDQGNLLNSMENICCAERAALILTHHFAKGDASTKNAIDRASGGGVFARWGDVMMTFTPHEQGDAMTVEMSLRYFPPVEPFVVRWVYPRWTRDKDLDPSKLKSSRGPKEKHSPDSVLHALGDRLMSFAEWQKATGLPDSTFKRKREELLADGRVEQVGPLYRKKKV